MFCLNPNCREEFSPTETANGFCSWECEEDMSAALDREEFAEIYDDRSAAPVF